MLGGAAQRAGFAVFELMTLVFERGDALQQRVLGFEQLAFGLLRSALLGEEFLTAVEFACLRGQRGELLCGVGEGGVLPATSPAKTVIRVRRPASLKDSTFGISSSQSIL